LKPLPTTSSGKLKAKIELLAPDHSTRRVHESLAARIVLFLHITTGPDNTDNVMALAFGCRMQMQG
jgi:hypothetical protein